MNIHENCLWSTRRYHGDYWMRDSELFNKHAKPHGCNLSPPFARQDLKTRWISICSSAWLPSWFQLVLDGNVKAQTKSITISTITFGPKRAPIRTNMNYQTNAKVCKRKINMAFERNIIANSFGPCACPMSAHKMANDVRRTVLDIVWESCHQQTALVHSNRISNWTVN